MTLEFAVVVTASAINKWCNNVASTADEIHHGQRSLATRTHRRVVEHTPEQTNGLRKVLQLLQDFRMLLIRGVQLLFADLTVLIDVGKYHNFVHFCLDEVLYVLRLNIAVT